MGTRDGERVEKRRKRGGNSRQFKTFALGNSSRSRYHISISTLLLNSWLIKFYLFSILSSTVLVRVFIPYLVVIQVRLKHRVICYSTVPLIDFSNTFVRYFY